MPTVFEPAQQDPNFSILWQQYLARLRNTEQLIELVGDSSGLEGDFESLEDVVAALVAQLPAQTDPVSITSGTSVSLITTIPSWARRVTVTLDAVTTTGTSAIILQIGPSGGLATANYMGSVSRVVDSAATLASLNTNGFRISNDHGAAVLIDGIATFELHDSTNNIWTFAWSGARDDTTARTITAAGRIALSGALTQIAITTLGGADTFDGSGTGRVRYER